MDVSDALIVARIREYIPGFNNPKLTHEELVEIRKFMDSPGIPKYKCLNILMIVNSLIYLKMTKEEIPPKYASLSEFNERYKDIEIPNKYRDYAFEFANAVNF